jgi:restriction endonuclease S subunit
MTTIKTFNGSTENVTFYIQSKGNNAGQPLTNPIPNCFAVCTDVENAFEIVYALFTAKAFNQYIIGSVIPFIRISTMKEIVLPAFDRTYDNNKLNAINTIDQQIENLNKQLVLIKQMQRAIANQIIKPK